MYKQLNRNNSNEYIDTTSESLEEKPEVLACEEILPTPPKVYSTDDETKFIETVPVPRSRSTPPSSTDILAARLEMLEDRVLGKLAEEDKSTIVPSSTITPPSDTLSSSNNAKETIQNNNVVAETSPITNSTPNQKNKSSLTTRVEAIEELVFDDGQRREGKIVSRIKEMENFIFDGSYSPPLNLTARVDALAQELELDI